MDSITYPRHVLKYNVSTPMLFGFDNAILSYERVYKPGRSWSVNVGFRNLPRLADPDSSFLINEYKKKGGISVMADYRFYLMKENRYPAPRGVFLAPFIIGFSDQFSTGLSVTKDGSPITDEFWINTELITFGAGLKLGYQFVFGDHWTVDLDLLGPSLSYYRLKMEVEDEVEIDEEYREYLEALRDILTDVFPGAQRLFNEGKLDESGTFSTTTSGFQYCIRIGYLF